MAPLTFDSLRSALAGRYDLRREIGAGGMATVYLAHDVRHGRDVALKVLVPDYTAVVGPERFHAEIRLTARLVHPHILTLFDSGEADGALFYAMPFVDGQSLRHRMTRERQMSQADAIQVAVDVLDALHYAHGEGIIHRDIKPENILMLHGQHALLTDFGIARAVGAPSGDRLTQVGLVLGTPMYMSPEQSVGDETLDGRSDVYAVGCVLYEMLVGTPPFVGSASQMIAKRLTQAPPLAGAVRTDLSPAIDDVLQLALAVDVNARIPTARAFADALKSAASPASSGARPTARTPDVPTVAVLPFVNMSADADAEFFSDGISEDLLSALARVSGLRVVARTSSFAFKGKQLDAREIGKALAARHLVEGSVRKAGSKVRITAELVDAEQGLQLWNGRYDREMTDIFAMQDEITSNIRDELSRHLLGIGDVVSRATPDIDAETYELFLRGRYLVGRLVDGMQRGMELLQQVVQRAPRFAPGYSALGHAMATLGWYCVLPSRDAFAQAKALATQALSIDPSDATAHAVAGLAALYSDWDWPAAHKHLSRAADLAPTDWYATSSLSLYYVSIGRFDEAIAQANRGMRADPVNPAPLNQLALVLHQARRFRECIAICDRVIELAPEFSEAWRWKGLSLHQLGDTTGGLEAVEKSVALSWRHVWPLANLALMHHVAGNFDQVDALMSEIEERAKTSFVPPYALAISAFRTPVPDLDHLWASLDKAVEARDFWLVMTRVEPFFDLVRQDPRYERLVNKIGIPMLPAAR